MPLIKPKLLVRPKKSSSDLPESGSISILKSQSNSLTGLCREATLLLTSSSTTYIENALMNDKYPVLGYGGLSLSSETERLALVMRRAPEVETGYLFQDNQSPASCKILFSYPQHSSISMTIWC